MSLRLYDGRFASGFAVVLCMFFVFAVYPLYLCNNGSSRGGSSLGLIFASFFVVADWRIDPVNAPGPVNSSVFMV